MFPTGKSAPPFGLESQADAVGEASAKHKKARGMKKGKGKGKMGKKAKGSGKFPPKSKGKPFPLKKGARGGNPFAEGF